MQEDILLVPYQDLSQWPNDLHLQFNQTQDEQMDAEFDVDNPCAEKTGTGHRRPQGCRGHGELGLYRVALVGIHGADCRAGLDP